MNELILSQTDITENAFEFMSRIIFYDKHVDDINDNPEIISLQEFCNKFKLKIKTVVRDLSRFNEFMEFVVKKEEVVNGNPRLVTYLTVKGYNSLLSYYGITDGYECNGFIYFISHIGLNDFVKIGMTHNIKQRMSGILTHSPLGINLVHYMPVVNCKRIESILHNRFYEYNINREWFNFEKLNLSDLIESIDNEFNIKNSIFEIHN